MDYKDLKNIFIAHESQEPAPKEHLVGHIVFAAKSFKKEYSEVSRTYAVSSDNKAFKPDAVGYSIYGYCLDGSDDGARLDRVMAEEAGGPEGWVVESCRLI